MLLSLVLVKHNKCNIVVDSCNKFFLPGILDVNKEVLINDQVDPMFAFVLKRFIPAPENQYIPLSLLAVEFVNYLVERPGSLVIVKDIDNYQAAMKEAKYSEDPHT